MYVRGRKAWQDAHRRFPIQAVVLLQTSQIDTILNNIAYSPHISYNPYNERTRLLSALSQGTCRKNRHPVRRQWQTSSRTAFTSSSNSGRPDATPPAISNKVLKHIKHKTGILDPYKSIKTQEFEEAVRAFQEVRPRFGNYLRRRGPALRPRQLHGLLHQRPL